LERFLRKKKKTCKPATIKHYLISLRVALKLAKRLGYSTPVVEIPVIKVHNQRLRYLSIDEERRLLEVLHPITGRFNTPATQLRDFHIQSRWDNYHITILLLDVGARVSEISNLRWRDVNLKERTINLYRSKVSNESVLLMTTRVHEVLTRRFKNRKQSMWVFTDKSGLNARKYAPTAMKKAFAAAGLDDISQPYHVYRHTFASHLASQGVSLQEIGLLLGHKSPETTAIYAHLQPNVTSAKATAILNDLNKSTKGPKFSVVNSPVTEQGDVNGECSR
jgi:integrase